MRRLWPVLRRLLLDLVAGAVVAAVAIAVFLVVVPLFREPKPTYFSDAFPYPPARPLSDYLRDGWELKTMLVVPTGDPKNENFPSTRRSAVLQKSGDILICDISFISATNGFKTDWCLPLK